MDAKTCLTIANACKNVQPCEYPTLIKSICDASLKGHTSMSFNVRTQNMEKIRNTLISKGFDVIISRDAVVGIDLNEAVSNTHRRSIALVGITVSWALAENQD